MLLLDDGNNSSSPARRLLSLLLFGLVTLLAAPAQLGAQTARDAQSQATTDRLVLLNVSGGGTEHLRAEMQQLDELELKGQSWFVQQIRDRGMPPKGIMSRTEDLVWLMEQSEMDYILYLVPKDDSTYTANLVEQSTGKPGLAVEADRTEAGLSKAGARLIRREVEAYLAPDPPEPEPEPEPQPEPPDPEEIQQRAEQQDEQKKKKAQRHWLWATGRFRLFKRDLTVAGSNNSVLSYTSTYYPGFEVDAEIYPLGPVNPDWAAAGLLLDYRQGFESVVLETADGSTSTIGVSQVELEGGPIFRLENPFKRTGNRLRPRMRFKVAVRYSNYSVDENDKLPSTSLTSVVFGALLSQPVLFDGFAAEAQLGITPVAFFGRGGQLFGSSSLTHAFATRIGAKYAFTEAIRMVAGYRFRLHHSQFEGPGASDFIDSEAFELVQGFDVGIQYEY